MLKNMYDYHIGNTPLRKLPDINGNQIFIKMEGDNFLGSIKARTGYYLINNLPDEADGKTIIESTSGNLGFALGYFCKETGRKFLALTDPSIAAFKQERLQRADIDFMQVQAELGFDYRSSRIRMAERMVASGEYFWVNQYDNPAGIEAHVATTAPEIWEQSEHQVTHVICAMGSCGTVCGLGRYFHSCSDIVKVIGVEPFGSTIFGQTHQDYINVGAGLVGKPGNLDKNPHTVDEAFTVLDYESIQAAQTLWHKYQIDAGVSTGMAYYIAEQIAKTLSGCYIVIISADGKEAYREYL